MISAIFGELRRAQEALRRSHDELEQRVAERTQELEGANRSLKEEIRRIEMLERSERRINEFLAMLGHELRNPLAPIRNALDLMRIKSAGDSTYEWARNIISTVKDTGIGMSANLIPIAWRLGYRPKWRRRHRK